MAGQQALPKTAREIEHEILMLDQQRIQIEMKLWNARQSLFVTQGKQIQKPHSSPQILSQAVQPDSSSQSEQSAFQVNGYHPSTSTASIERTTLQNTGGLPGTINNPRILAQEAAQSKLLSHNNKEVARLGRGLTKKRSPSVEITDRRPRQQPRKEEQDRVTTPPLNDRAILKEEDNPFSASGLDRSGRQQSSTTQLDFGPFSLYDAAPPLAQQQTSRGDIGESRNVLPESAYQQRPQPSVHQLTNAIGHRILDTSAETTSEQSPHRQRQNTGTPALIAKASQSNTGHDTDLPRPTRAAARRPQGSYKVATYKPLSPHERHSLEMRYCGMIALIIGTKVCVSMAPTPYSSETIFERLRRRLGHTPDPNVVISDTELYRTSADFVSDAKRMLEDYVKLGHCPDCPFEATGNARVMCYRVRLAAVIDLKMRDLKQAVRECELDFEADDYDGRRTKIDEWFQQGDFERDSHIQT